MALYRLVCAFGHQGLVTVLTRCGLPLPTYFLADEKHSHCLTAKVYLPTIVSGRVIWHLGYTEEASAAAFTQSYQAFQRAASQQEASYRVRGVLTDGFDSTTKSMRTLFPGARLGNCLRHALTKIPKKLTAIASPVRTALRSQFHTFTANQHEPFDEFPAEDFPQPTERTGVIHEVILHREQMPPGAQERLGHAVPFDPQHIRIFLPEEETDERRWERIEKVVYLMSL